MPHRLLIALVCGSVVITLSMGLRQVFGLFLRPVSVDIGTSRELFGLVIGLQNLLWGLTQPLAGWLADRFGAARVVLAGGLTYVAGLGLGALSTGPGSWGLTVGMLVGLAQSGTAYAVVLGAIARAAPAEKRSLALGIAATAGSIGMFTLVPVTHQLIEWFDWRVALLALAGLAAVMPLLSIGLRGDAARAPPAAEHTLTLRETVALAARHPGFWMINAGFAACGFQLAFLSTHLPSLLADRGLPPSTGAAALAVIGLANIGGTYLCGMLGGRFLKKRVLAVLYVARCLLFAGFIAVPASSATALMFAVAIGLIWTATVPLTSGLVGDIFGPRHMGLLFGTVYVGHQLGAFAGTWAGGFAFDHTGSYAAVWLAAIVLGLIAALLHWPLPDRPAGWSGPHAKAA